MKTIYHAETCLCGELDFFFNEKFDILHYWCKNDANFSGEYMGPLFKELGYKVVELQDRDKRIFPQIKAELLDIGVAAEEDFE